MKLFGSITELVSAVFRKDTFQQTLRPSQTVTYTADRDIQLPPEDASSVLVSTTATQTLTNKSISGASNTITGVSLTSGVTGTLSAASGGTGVSNSSTLTLGADNTTLTTSGVTSITLPTSGTLATLVGTETLSNKTLGTTTTLTVKDSLLSIVDDGDVTKVAQFQASGITTGTTRTYTLPDASVTLASRAGTETLSNKTLDNSTTATIKDNQFTLVDDGDTSKTAQFQLSGISTATNRAYALPDANSTLCVTATSQTLTNKNISGASNTISNVDLTTAVSGLLPISSGGTGAGLKSSAFNALSPMISKGDLISSDGTNGIRLGVGSDGLVLTADSGQTSGLNWTSVLTNPMTTAGDIIIGGSGGAATRLAVGTSTTVLLGGTNPTYGQITNSQVSSSAAIAYSKLSLTGSIVNGDVSASAAIAGSKIQAVSASNAGVLTTGSDTIQGIKIFNSGTSHNDYLAMGSHYNGTSYVADTTNNTLLISRNSANGGINILTANGTSVGSSPSYVTAILLGSTGEFFLPSIGSGTGTTLISSGGSNQVLKQSSSRRYKTNILDLPSERSEAVYNLRPVTYNSTTGNDDPSVTFLGFIAEEVDLVDSTIVPKVPLNGELVPESVDYARITVMLVSEIKKLRDRIVALESKGS